VTAALHATSVYFIRLGRAGQSTILIALLNPLFVLGAMGLGLGSLVDDRSSLGGIEYLDFIAPALMAAFAMQAAAGASLWPVLGGLKWEGTYVAQVSTPLRPVDVLLGQLTYTTSDIALRVVTTFIAMVVFGAMHSLWGVLAIPVAVLTGFTYAAPITAFVATQETDVTFPLIFRLGIIPSYSVLGHVLPGVAAAERAGGDRQAHAAVARRRPVPVALAGHGDRRRCARAPRLSHGVRARHRAVGAAHVRTEALPVSERSERAGPSGPAAGQERTT
jgi:hypothetical protein